MKTSGRHRTRPSIPIHFLTLVLLIVVPQSMPADESTGTGTAAPAEKWLGSIVVVGWRSRRSLTTPWGRVVWMGALGCFITITLSGVMTTTFHTEGAMAFSAIIGLLLAAPHLPVEEPGVPLEARPSLTTVRRT